MVGRELGRVRCSQGDVHSLHLPSTVKREYHCPAAVTRRYLLLHRGRDGIFRRLGLVGAVRYPV